MKKTLLVLVALLCVCVYALPAMAATSPLDDPSVLPETNESGFLPEGESRMSTRTMGKATGITWIKPYALRSCAPRKVRPQ